MKHAQHAIFQSTPSTLSPEARQAPHFMKHIKHAILWSRSST